MSDKKLAKGVEETTYGFTWHAHEDLVVNVERCCSGTHGGRPWIALRIESPSGILDVTVTKRKFSTRTIDKPKKKAKASPSSSASR